MANRHSLMWRQPGRRDEERQKFSALMRKIEAVRLRKGWTKRELAAELHTNEDALRNWMTGRAIGRWVTIAKLRTFLERGY